MKYNIITMTTEIRYVNAVKNEHLEAQIKQKMDKLYQKFDWITQAVVFLKDEKHPEDRRYKCEIKLSVPGPLIFAESQEVNFNAAITRALNDLKVQLGKRKDKMYQKR